MPSLVSFVGKGGKGGIRTHGGASPAAVFETAPIVHSGTFPPDIIAQAPEPSKSNLAKTLDKVNPIRPFQEDNGSNVQ